MRAVASVLFGCLWLTLAGWVQLAPVVAAPLPDGWQIYPTPAPDACAWSRANLSKREWRVRLAGGRLVIEPTSVALAVSDPTAPKFRIPRDMFPPDYPACPECVMRVEDGWLVGDNFGEWGGRLWWTDVAGGNARPVSGAGRCMDIADTGPPFFSEQPGEPFEVSNTVSLKRVMGRVFAFSGSSHLGFSSGSLSRIDRRGDGWRSCLVRNLEGAPEVVMADTANSWLALIAGGIFPTERAGALVRVRTDGALLELAQPAFLGLGSGVFANSMVKLPDATLYVGMRHFVGRLVPMADGSYRDELLLPSDRPPFDFEPWIDAPSDRGPSFPQCGVRKW